MKAELPTRVSLRSCFVAISLVLVCTASAVPQSSGSSLTFAVIDTAPFGTKNEAGEPDGIYPALLRALSQESGISIKVVLVPFARAAFLVTSGAVDGTIMFKTEGTEGRTVPLIALFETGVIVQAAPGLKLRRKADLAPQLIGRIRGGCQDLETDASAHWRFYELNTQEQGVAMLVARRIDAFCTVPEAIALAMGKFAGSSAIDEVERLTISSKKVWILLNPRVPDEVRRRLIDATTILRESEQVKAIFRERLGPTYILKLPR